METQSLLFSPSGVRSFGSFDEGIDTLSQTYRRCSTISPWNPYYRVFWHITALGAILTAFLVPYQVAFEEDPGFFKRSADLLEKTLTLIFTVDIFVNFSLAFYKDEKFVVEREQIAREYLKFMFWVDAAGVIPFGSVLHFWAVQMGASDETILIISTVHFVRFARLHRIKKLSDELRNNVCVNLLTFTLLRNFSVVVMACHVQACIMYFLARIQHFGADTWLGPVLYQRETSFERYVTALYWAITTFCTVGMSYARSCTCIFELTRHKLTFCSFSGYGDFEPKNLTEKIAGSLFMLVNIVVAAWIIGSVTLLMLTGDNKTREYRESLEHLDQYGSMHKFDPVLMTKLRRQLELEFNNREVADEQILRYFPSAVRRKILRRLYIEHLAKTDIMNNVRPQFVDAFLASCTVEIFRYGSLQCSNL